MSSSVLIDEMLSTAKTIAVVGISDKPWRASHNIAAYLSKHGYRVVAVNPALSEVVIDGKIVDLLPNSGRCPERRWLSRVAED